MDDLNATHVESVSHLLDKLDKMVMKWGTHVTGKAKFIVIDDSAIEVVVTIEWSPTGGCHYLVG
jgi:hypothetical protein